MSLARRATAPKPPAAPRRRRAVSGSHDDRLTAILTTAANLFAENGYDATSLDMIADRLGMHKATLYHYVDGKETILFLCQSRSFTDLEAVHERMRDRTRPVLERLREFALHLARAQNTEFGRCLTMVGPKPLARAAGGQIKKIQRRLDTIVRDLIDEGIAGGVLRPGDAALCSAMLFGALNWVPRWYRAEGRYSVEQIASVFFDIFERGVRAPDAHVTTPARPRRSTAALRSRPR